jgi:hypothetical protein
MFSRCYTQLSNGWRNSPVGKQLLKEGWVASVSFIGLVGIDATLYFAIDRSLAMTSTK